MKELKRISVEKTGINIKKMIFEKGLMIKDVADLLYICEHAIYKWFWGQSLPSIDNLYKLSQILECSIDEIIKPEREEK